MNKLSLKKYALQTVALTVLVFGLAACGGGPAGESATAPAASDSLAPRIDALLANMTLEDKVGEMTQLTLDMLCVGEPYNLEEPHRLDSAKLYKALVDLRVGSILNVGGHAYPREQWYGFISAIQRVAMTKKSTGIPVLYGIDAIHGTNYTSGATLFPQQIAQAATWNPALVEEASAITAYETRASGIPWDFSPVLDVGRDARWPRLWETYGEDVVLARELGLAAVRGYQGDNPAHPEKVAACLKHFLGYSVTLTGKDRTQAWVAERQLREYFLPTFQAAIDAGALTIMVNSGEMNGIPVHVNKSILTDLLRDELGFEGLLVTDWEDIRYLFSRHKVAHDYKEAVRLAINAGIDMSMVPTDLEFPKLLAELVREGAVPMARIDESVRRILRVKLQLGLFEQPYHAPENYPKFGSEEHAAASYATALEAITLLKNDNGLLPLEAGKTVLVTGPTAHSLNNLNGGWTGTWQGVDPTYNTPGKMTILEALQDRLGADKVRYAAGASTTEVQDLAAAVQAARASDVAIVCLGETPYTEKPGDMDDLNLPDAQYQLAEAIAATGTPVVLVMVGGRPRVFQRIEPLASGIFMAYLPGNEGGPALADLLTGKANPSGKLPFTYPRYSASLLTYDHKHTDRIDRQFGQNAYDPQFPFGFGLSYTSFAYANLTLSTASLQENASLTVSVDVTNTGERAGKEVVQLYVADQVASITPPVKRLRGFEKVTLSPGETQTVSFTVQPSDLAFVGQDLQWVTEPGAFTVSIDTLHTDFNYQLPSAN